MKITSKKKRSHTEILDVPLIGFTLQYGLDGWEVDVKMLLSLEQVEILNREGRLSNLDMIFKSAPEVSEALKWDGTHQGLKQITKELGVGFLMGLDEKTDEAVYFIASGEKQKVHKGEFVTRFADGTVKVLTHSDITVNYIIGG